MPNGKTHYRVGRSAVGRASRMIPVYPESILATELNRAVNGGNRLELPAAMPVMEDGFGLGRNYSYVSGRAKERWLKGEIE